MGWGGTVNVGNFCLHLFESCDPLVSGNCRTSTTGICSPIPGCLIGDLFLMDTPLSLLDLLSCFVSGNLRFAYLQKSDEHSGRIYSCNVYNPFLAMTVRGSYATLQVTAGMR